MRARLGLRVGPRCLPRRIAKLGGVAAGGVALATDPVVEAYKRGIDRSLLRENLRLTVEQRFLKLRQLQRFAEELRRARRAMAP